MGKAIERTGDTGLNSPLTTMNYCIQIRNISHSEDFPTVLLSKDFRLSLGLVNTCTLSFLFGMLWQDIR